MTEDKVWGEGTCVLQAGPGAGEVIALDFDVGFGEAGLYDGEVTSDWTPPEGSGMADADYSAKLYSGTLYVNWATRVPVPDSDEAMTVEGAVVADRD